MGQGWVTETETETEYPYYRYFSGIFGNVITGNEILKIPVSLPETKKSFSGTTGNGNVTKKIRVPIFNVHNEKNRVTETETETEYRYYRYFSGIFGNAITGNEIFKIPVSLPETKKSFSGTTGNRNVKKKFGYPSLN